MRPLNSEAAGFPADQRSAVGQTVFAAIINAIFGKPADNNQRELNELLARCEELMRFGDCDAVAFDRLTRLLHKEGRYAEEFRFCNYVSEWAASREREHLFAAKIWLNSKYKRVIARLEKAKALSGGGD